MGQSILQRIERQLGIKVTQELQKLLGDDNFVNDLLQHLDVERTIGHIVSNLDPNTVNTLLDYNDARIEAGQSILMTQDEEEAYDYIMAQLTKDGAAAVIHYGITALARAYNPT